MNVVGKVGSLISQGVYSVATPFHPFGGAVDVIVVQQQDGTFRSTPWYVRFGKFQGVLKGAEKIVHIAVNGVEADFHMYLDNSGEAYFLKEVTSGDEEKGVLKEGDNMESAQRDSGNDGKGNLGRIERTASDSGRSFYDFQDEQSSLEDPVELSEYGSTRYNNLDVEEHCVESENSNSEVVLVSVDGHVLTAPISSLERNTDDDVQLSTPRFHLGPGQEAEFCEDTVDFTTGDEAWTANYQNVLGTSEDSKDSCGMETAINASISQLEVHAGDEEHPCKVEENVNIVLQESESGTETSPEAASIGILKDDIFKSCLDIPTLVGHDKNSPLESIENADHSQYQCAPSAQHAIENGHTDTGVSPYGVRVAPSSSCSPGKVESPSRNLPDETEVMGEYTSVGVAHMDSENSSANDTVGESAVTGHIDSENTSPYSVTHNSELEEKVDDTLAVEQCSPQGPKDKSWRNEIVDPDKATSSDKLKTDSSMGSIAAAKVFEEHRVSKGDFKTSAEAIIKNENLIVKCQDKYLPWDKAAPIVLGAATYSLDLPVDPKDAISVEQNDESKSGDGVSQLPPTPGLTWRLWPIPFRRVRTLEHTISTSSNDEVFTDSESGLHNQPVVTTPTSTSGNEHKQFLRINVLTTEQIASLNLKDGQNMVTFSFFTRILGMQQVHAHIYLWKWNARIVISDVDGTITKSDVLGQFMPLVGRDWTQSGVARLFSAIKENGYQLLFLSARAIVQAYLTKSFLSNIKQDGKALPNGPVVISPDGLFPSLFREVIRRAPHEFKIACLEDIKALFPPDYNPFYAGFGNRDTDELSYRKIGIPKGKIFIINPKGEVAISQHRIDVKSYTSLHTLVNDMFPPTSMVEQEDFNSWNYWRMPLPDID